MLSRVRCSKKLLTKTTSTEASEMAERSVDEVTIGRTPAAQNSGNASLVSTTMRCAARI